MPCSRQELELLYHHVANYEIENKINYLKIRINECTGLNQFKVKSICYTWSMRTLEIWTVCCHHVANSINTAIIVHLVKAKNDSKWHTVTQI